MTAVFVPREYIILGGVHYNYLNSIISKLGVEKQYFKCQECRARLHVWVEIRRFQLSKIHTEPTCMKAHAKFLRNMYDSSKIDLMHSFIDEKNLSTSQSVSLICTCNPGASLTQGNNGDVDDCPVCNTLPIDMEQIPSPFLPPKSLSSVSATEDSWNFSSSLSSVSTSDLNFDADISSMSSFNVSSINVPSLSVHRSGSMTPPSLIYNSSNNDLNSITEDMELKSSMTAGVMKSMGNLMPQEKEKRDNLPKKHPSSVFLGQTTHSRSGYSFKRAPPSHWLPSPIVNNDHPRFNFPSPPSKSVSKSGFSFPTINI